VEASLALCNLSSDEAQPSDTLKALTLTPTGRGELESLKVPLPGWERDLG